MNHEQLIEKLEAQLDSFSDILAEMTADVGNYESADLCNIGEAIEHVSFALNMLYNQRKPAIPSPPPERKRNLQLDEQ